MRNIQKYTSDYDCMDDPANRFETEYQVVYRRKKVLEELKRYQHDTIYIRILGRVQVLHLLQNMQMNMY